MLGVEREKASVRIFELDGAAEAASKAVDQ